MLAALVDFLPPELNAVERRAQIWIASSSIVAGSRTGDYLSFSSAPCNTKKFVSYLWPNLFSRLFLGCT